MFSGRNIYWVIQRKKQTNKNPQNTQAENPPPKPHWSVLLKVTPQCYSFSVFVHGADFSYCYLRNTSAGPNLFLPPLEQAQYYHHVKKKHLPNTCTSESLPKECAAVVLELKNRPSPRSPSFTTPVAVMNTLAGFISRGEEKKDI